MTKGETLRPNANIIQPAPMYDSSAKVLWHLHRECERTGYKLAPAQSTAAYDLENSPDERALALLHHWWCYDLQKLLDQMPQTLHPKPRIYLSVWVNHRGTLIVSWRPLAHIGDDYTDSDFCQNPCSDTKEVRLIEVREFRTATVFHERRPPEWRWPIADVRAGISENVIASDGLILQAALALIGELKKRLSFCFSVTMIEDVYVEWGQDQNHIWDFGAVFETWKIKNVAAHEAEEDLKLIDAFETSYGCSLVQFVEIAFSPDKKGRTGPTPLPHTKTDRSVRRFKALGYPKLTPSVVSKYAGLLKRYRANLLPVGERLSASVVPFRPKN